MPPGTLQYAQCFTDDAEAVAARLQAVLSLHAAAIFGPGSAGRIEVVPLPSEGRGRLTPGTMPISFAVDDLDGRVAACRAAGLDVTVAPHGAAALPYAVVSVAGLEFELVAADF